MAKVRRITLRLSEASLDVIRQHQQHHGFVEWTEAIEDILKRFAMSQNSIRSKFKRYLAGDPNIKPLEAFNAQNTP